MSKAICVLLLLAALTLTIKPTGAAQTGTGPKVGAVAIRAFIISVDDARAPQLADELNSVLKSPQSTPAAAYQAVKGIVNEQVRKNVARREWDPDAEGAVSPDNRAILTTISIPIPPLRRGKSKKPAPAYNINGTSGGRQLAVTPSVDAANGRADKLTIRYSATELPNSAAFVHDPHETTPEPKVVADLIPET